MPILPDDTDLPPIPYVTGFPTFPKEHQMVFHIGKQRTYVFRWGSWHQVVPEVNANGIMKSEVIPGRIVTDKIQAGSVTTIKLADHVITTTKLSDMAVDTVYQPRDSTPDVPVTFEFTVTPPPSSSSFDTDMARYFPHRTVV